jgi:hypothetical protein
METLVALPLLFYALPGELSVWRPGCVITDEKPQTFIIAGQMGTKAVYPVI